MLYNLIHPIYLIHDIQYTAIYNIVYTYHLIPNIPISVSSTINVLSSRLNSVLKIHLPTPPYFPPFSLSLSLSILALSFSFLAISFTIFFSLAFCIPTQSCNVLHSFAGTGGRI